MNRDVRSVWQKKEDVKIKQRGIAALATCVISNSSKVTHSSTRYVWPAPSLSSASQYKNTLKSWKV